MKFINKVYILLTAFLCLFATSCQDLTELNKNPNSPVDVSPNFIITYVLTNTGKTVYNLGKDDSKIGSAMQYMQVGTNENAAVINQYAWTQESWGGYYDLLRNNQLIYEAGVRDNNRFTQAVALVMKSYLFGLLTDLFGDVPYSEALRAKEGTFFPKYDSQADIYKGILTDLREADALLSALEAKDAISTSADVLYKGDGAKWRRFANSLRLRYAMRLSEKANDMKALGMDIEAEFKAAAANAFTSKSDDASLAFLGTAGDNANPGGPINSSNPNFKLKPAKPFVDKLLELNDPRLHRFVQPVQRKWDSRVTTETQVTVTNIFGENYTVTLVPAHETSADTSMYVGLPIGLPITQAISYNKGNDQTAYHNERNPYISFLHDRYRKNTDPYVLMNLMTYSEVEFLLAEAALRGNFGVTDAEGHYKKAIRAAMDKVGIFESSQVDFEAYYAQPKVDYNTAANKLERIMEQKWISGWFGIQSWFDWRRTGYPALKAGEVAQYGDALPIRYIYPSPNLDPNYLVNYDAAVSRLEATNHIPSGQSKDHHYAKMWLLQGTSKPW